MSLIERLIEGCVYACQRWSGDCGEMSLIDETKTDELLIEAADRIQKLEAALKRLRDCDWVITPHDRMDAVRAIAREALL
jgi:hypothetical protein